MKIQMLQPLEQCVCLPCCPCHEPSL